MWVEARPVYFRHHALAFCDLDWGADGVFGASDSFIENPSFTEAEVEEGQGDDYNKYD